MIAEAAAAQPIASDSYLMIRQEVLGEFAPDGSVRRTVAVPQLGGATESTRDLMVGADGRIYVFSWEERYARDDTRQSLGRSDVLRARR